MKTENDFIEFRVACSGPARGRRDRDTAQPQDLTRSRSALSKVSKTVCNYNLGLSKTHSIIHGITLVDNELYLRCCLRNGWLTSLVMSVRRWRDAEKYYHNDALILRLALHQLLIL